MSEGIKWAMWPKIVQVNATDVYIVGGNDTNVNNERNWNQQGQEMNNHVATIKVNVRDGSVIRCADMKRGRQAQGMCNIGN